MIYSRLRGLGLTEAEMRAMAWQVSQQSQPGKVVPPPSPTKSATLPPGSGSGFTPSVVADAATIVQDTVSSDVATTITADVQRCFEAVMTEFGWTPAQITEYLAGGGAAFMERLEAPDRARFRAALARSGACTPEVLATFGITPSAGGTASWLSQNRNVVIGVGAVVGILGLVLVLKRRR